MGAKYTVLQTDVKTGNVVTRLPVTGIEYADSLNESGAASVGIPLFAPEADPAALSPGISGLSILRDNAPIWAGIVWGATADLDAGTLTLTASGFHSYYKRRYLDGKRGYARKSVDQSVLLKDWISYANSNGGIGTDISAVTARGHLRTREWSFYEFKNIAGAIEELADDLNGFNFRYEPFWATAGVRIGHRLKVVSRGTETFPQLEHRASCNVTSVTYDGTQLATQAYAFGADLGTGAKPYASSSNPALTAPRMVSVATYSDIKTTASLLPKAAAIATVGSQPIAVPSLTVYPGQFSPVQFLPGAVGTVIVDSGYVALLEEFVITERRVGVDVNGTESISLALASKDVFNNGNSS
ncbi:hypothetical protein QWJ26_07165 [Streptomyces sp. CSDS2]|uniref:hypothetical protein n=1 Tax=Streptomyces sp. CSDS2 TaxID=3055051 RepID=UPI0025AF7B9F|nr:hypothetical protein [Streptomyces sp. CSDS2]MDN3259597.1 hypothetical protein [Streptomyces sp. CSDS2]